jgi:hypothetical protein
MTQQVYFEDDPVRWNLKSAVNVRQYEPRVCAFCHHCVALVYDDDEYTGDLQCERPNGPSFHVGDGRHYQSTCDSFRRAKE